MQSIPLDFFLTAIGLEVSYLCYIFIYNPHVFFNKCFHFMFLNFVAVEDLLFFLILCFFNTMDIDFMKK